MRSRPKPALRGLAVVSVLALVLTGCGSGATDAAGIPSQQALGAPDRSKPEEGYPLPDCSGLDPASCTYDGFDPDVHGFGFENWGGVGDIGATELIALFGRKKVCASGSGSACTLFPAARQWAAQVNEAMAGGHCEGMAVLAARLFLGYDKLEDLDPSATSTFDLARETPAVAQAIEKWWATQMLPPVQQAYQEFQTYQPSKIAAALANGLAQGVGYTMGIYSEAGGHAITPIGVTKLGGRFAVSAYDNNFPGTVQRILIDPAAESWSYAMGSTNPDAPTGGWEGGQGTIELTPMESRSLPAESPFTDSSAKGAATNRTSQLLVTSPDPSTRLGLLVTIGGQTYDLSDPAADLPDGVVARSTLGSVLAGRGLAVAVDRTKVGAFTAELSVPDDQTGTFPVTMSIDDPSTPRVTLRGVVDPGAGKSAAFSVGKGGRVTVDSSEIGDAQVNVSNGLSSADFDLPEGVDMSVSARGSDGATDIEYVDEDGDSIGAFELEYETDDGSVVDIVADFDENSGDFDISVEEAEAEEVDSALLAVWEDDLIDEGRSSAGDESADSDSAGEESVDPDPAGDAGDSGAGDPAGDAGDSGTSDPADGTADESSNGGNESGGGNDSAGSDLTNDEPIVEQESVPDANGAEAE